MYAGDLQLHLKFKPEDSGCQQGVDGRFLQLNHDQTEVHIGPNLCLLKHILKINQIMFF